MRAVIGGVCALIAVLAAVLLVMVASAESDATPAPPVVLVPHGAEPTIYAGPGAARAAQRALALSPRQGRHRPGQGLSDRQVRRRARPRALRPGRDEDQRPARDPDLPRHRRLVSHEGRRAGRRHVRDPLRVGQPPRQGLRRRQARRRAQGRVPALRRARPADGRHAPQPRRARRLARADRDEARRLASPLVQLRRHQPRRQHPAHRRERALLSADADQARRRRGAVSICRCTCTTTASRASSA